MGRGGGGNNPVLPSFHNSPEETNPKKGDNQSPF